MDGNTINGLGPTNVVQDSLMVDNDLPSVPHSQAFACTSNIGEEMNRLDPKANRWYQHH